MLENYQHLLQATKKKKYLGLVRWKAKIYILIFSEKEDIERKWPSK
jgi:hypothetical protein